MKESELLGKLLPSHPDLIPIIENIREKYGIPEVLPEDDIDEILLTRDDIDWGAVRNDIETQVQGVQLLDDPAAKFAQTIKDLQNMPLDLPELDSLPEETKLSIKKTYEAIIRLFSPFVALIDTNAYQPLSELIFDFLLTGKTRDVPEGWIGKVFTQEMFGNKTVIAMAGEAADPKAVAEQFKSEFTKTFGKDRPKITETHLATAEYLAQKLSGKSLKYLVETYEERHPSEFPKNRNSKAYRQAVIKHQEMMKKRIQRLQETIEKLVGDKK